MTWSTYRPAAGPTGRLHLRPGAGGGPLAGSTGTPAFGSRFDDTTWAAVLAARGWERGPVGEFTGWLSPGPGLRILLAVLRLDVTGLDSSPMIIGFRPDDADTDELYRVEPNGDGEIIVDKLVHAGVGFDREAFLAWLRTDSLADARRV